LLSFGKAFGQALRSVAKQSLPKSLGLQIQVIR
jgi:hypothetical protein